MKIRINITNQCNLECSFCCVYGSPANSSFISFEKFKHIIDDYSGCALEVKLEGGEPLLHPRLFLFLEYLASKQNLKKVIIQTNGIILMDHINHIVGDANRLNIPVELKVAINDMVLYHNPDHMKTCRLCFDLSQKYPNIRTSFAVRYMSEEDMSYLLSLIDEYSIPRIMCDVDSFKSYGRLTGSEYPAPNELPCNEICYASDGECFGQDLISRAEHEKGIVAFEQGKIVFDNANHYGMWRDTIKFIENIDFHGRCNCDNIFEHQKDYIRTHRNENNKYMIEQKIYNYAKYYATRFSIQRYCKYDPFIQYYNDCCGEMLIEEFHAVIKAMIETKDECRYYKYRTIAIEIADYISKMRVRNNIELTDKELNESLCCCSSVY